MTLVSPFILYASEIWDIYGYDHIDKIYIKFCENLLGVPAQTPNYAVYGDLGRFPLSFIAKERIMKYWLKILLNRNSITFKILFSQAEAIDIHAQPSRFRHKRYWAEGIKCLLDDLGFSHLWFNQDFEMPCYVMIRNRIRDHFTQNWYVYQYCFDTGILYSQFKTEFKLEKYVECISNDMLRSQLAALCLSAHNLEIERERHLDVPTAVSARWEWLS